MSSALSMLKSRKSIPLQGPRGKGHDAARGCVFPECPPSDSELMSAMMQRLTQLEATVKRQAQEIDSKEQRITFLERELNRPDVDDKELLVETCHRLQTQVSEMELFLSDYGLIWVGDGGRSMEEEEEEEEEKELQTWSPERTMWHPDTSTAPGFHVNFDLVLRNIRQLNLAGDGECCVQATAHGARLAPREPIQLRLYSNGMVMFQGPFRSYQEPSTQQCLEDLMDGYFPSELQGRYPDGQPFHVHDHRHEEFTVRPLWAEFPGKGLAVGAGNKPTSSIPGRKLTMEQFLNRLPKAVIKGGKVIDIRNSVKATLQGSSDAQNRPATLVDTPALQALDERLRRRGSDPRSSADDAVTTLRVKSEDGSQSYIVKMHGSETIDHLRQYLDKRRGDVDPGYDIISVFPRQSYRDGSRTLASCGLTQSATLLLRPQRGSSQSPGPHD